MRKSARDSDANVGVLDVRAKNVRAGNVRAIHELPLQQALPGGWQWTTMGDISDVVGGGTPRTNVPEYYEKGRIPWITPADLSGYTNKYISHGNRYITEAGLNKSSARMMPAGTVLFTSRAPIGYVTIAKKQICTNQGFKSFVLKKDILPDYVYWWLKGNKNLAESFASGTTFLELSGAKAKQLPIPLAPPTEQKLIVSEIEKQFSCLDEAVAALKRIKANLKRYKSSVLKAAVEGKLTEEWRKEYSDVEPASELLKRILIERRKKWGEAELAKMRAKGKEPKDDKWKKRYKEPTVLDRSNLPELPDGWMWTSLAQLSSHIVDGTHHTPTYIDEGIDFISAKDIADWKINFNNCRKIPLKEHKELINRCYPQYGHVVVTKSGTIGRVAVVKTNRQFSLFESVALIPLLAELTPEYVSYVVHHSVLGAYGRKWQKGVAVRHLHLEDLRRLPVPLPPVTEQKKIVEKFESTNTTAENNELEIEAALKRAERLRQSILKKAFSGKLI